ncbi:MAG: hypothetical protein ACK5YO_27065, partial [Planctomyces sp.]
MDGSSSKETSCRRSCREGNRPQPLEVASLLKLAATNVLFPGLFIHNTNSACNTGSRNSYGSAFGRLRIPAIILRLRMSVHLH